MEPIFIDTFTADGKNFDLYATKYLQDNSLALIATEPGIHEVYATITIYLGEHNMYPCEGSVFINHDIVKTPFYDGFKSKFGEASIPVRYGYATSEELKLKKDVSEKIKEVL